MFQKSFIALLITFILTGCATRTRWAIDGENEINFVNGKIMAFTQVSKEEMNEFEFVTLELKITNTSSKAIDIDTKDIILLTEEGQVIGQMTRDELVTLSRSRSAFSTSIGVGFGHYSHFGNSVIQSRQAENSLMEFFDGNTLKNGAIPTQAFKQGLVFFAVPKKSSEKLTFKFENSLESQQQIIIYKKK